MAGKQKRPLHRITASKARERLADVINEVAFNGERVILHRHGRNVAAIIPIEDFKLLEALEDRFDVQEALKSIAEPGSSIPWEKVRRGIGL